MGLDIHISGQIPADDDWNKKVAAYKAMRAAGLTGGDTFYSLRDYLGVNGTNDPPEGRVVGIKSAITGDVMYDEGGAVIDLTKLPKGVTKILVQASC